MTEDDGLRRYLKAGMTFTETTRAHAEQLLRELVKTGESECHRAQDWVENLVKTSGDRSAAFISTVRAEVQKPFKALAHTGEDDLVAPEGHVPSPPPAASRQPTKGGAKKTPTTKVVTRKAPDKKLKKAAGA